MAVERQRGGAGTGNKPKPAGNTPKPGGNTPKPRPGTPSAKEASRAQSRPVSGKAGGGKGGGRGGNTPRPGGGRQAAAGPRGRSGALIAWGAVGLVIVVVVVLVIVKATGGGSTAATYTPVTPAPASIVSDVTTIPASVYDTVGVNIPSVAQPNPPIVLSNQPALTIDGKTPAMFYYGAEYCPYCAAERWAMTAALSRFGTWTNLDVTASSHTDVAPATPTFSYRNATYTSQYLTFFPVEQYTNIPSGSGYTILKNADKSEQAVINKYSTSTYIPGATAGQVGFPFIDIGNVALISGATYSPLMLAGLSHNDIASHLNDPTNSVTQSIVGTANYISAAICASTKQQPTAVCTSAGVKAAATALKLS
ncbi:MAG TPA: DUF929 family protein [Acidimicrobiales bacterium]|jgi:hypothetical protein|nr:DUF929 family protein [Acidimicrobiales bacterium]